MEMEISSGKADYKAAAITTCPGYRRSCAAEGPVRYEQFLTSGDGPNDHRRILG